MPEFRQRHAAIVGCFACLALAAPAQAQVIIGPSAASSEAFGISAEFTSSGTSTGLGPVDDLAGSAPPAYNKTKALAAYDHSVAVPPLVPNADIVPTIATFRADAKTLVSHVASPGIGIDFVTALGASTVGSADLSIVTSGPPGTSTATLALLNLGVSATKVDTSANFSQTFPGPGKVSGSASFGSLSITGALVDGKTITYAGSAPPNTVLYSSPTVTITANQQIVIGLISCSPNCVFTPYGITVRALDINLDKASINEFPMSGDIVLGDASAR